METCTNCGKILNALNMSDNDYSLCQDCETPILDELFKDMDTTLILWESKQHINF